MEIAVLLLSILLAVVFFIQDQKEWDSFSYRLWVPLIWVLITSTKIISILFPSNSQIDQFGIKQYLEGNIYNRFFLTLLLILAFFIIYKENRFAAVFSNVNLPLLSLYIFSFTSILWSTHPTVSLKRWIIIAGHYLMAFIVLIHHEREKALEHLLRKYFFLVILFSFITLKFFKKIGFEITAHNIKVWAGIMTHKNELGAVTSLAIIFLIWRILKQKKIPDFFDSLTLLLALYLLTRSGSATALAMIITGLAVLSILSIQKFTHIKWLIISSFVLFMLLILLLPNLLNKILIPFANLLGREATLTGRIPMWANLIKIGSQKPWLGSGFENFWLENYLKLWAKYTFRPNQAHNGYIEVFLNLGIFGFMLLIFFLFNNFINLIKELNENNFFPRLLFAFLIVILLNNLTEAFFIKPNLEWFLLIFLGINSHERDEFKELTY